MNKNWKVKYLPFLYRECPTGNAHWRGNHICYCCKGKDRNWTYVWHGKTKGWIPAEYVLDTSSNASSVSWSGQLSTSELLWNGVRMGLLIATFALVIGGILLSFLWNSGKDYKKNVQYKHEHLEKDSE